eukprot:TRINITY_DN1473_c0_g1_i1.p1 TRINITY_DN1473_c0_g1~~TRINITY_DN1473_c0_g1_i1.p1  ORF type:complete len:137 (+),score=20.03 TRINITY_DN1473_c0_g1_i1:145-555(+)
MAYDSRAALGLGAPGEASRTRWGAPKETEETRGLDNRSIYDLNEQKMRDQDKLLDMLGESVDRQKHLATAIGTEVEEQIDLLEHLDGEVGKTTGRVQKAAHRVQQLNMKSSSTWLWIVICILFLILIVLVFLAFYF